MNDSNHNNPYQPPSAALTPPPGVEEKGSVGRGIGLLVLLHLFQIPMSAFGAFILIGLSQLLYVLPAVYLLHRSGRKATIKGVWIGAGLTFLVNSACFTLVFSSAMMGGWH